jgi:ERCC4-related helicase
MLPIAHHCVGKSPANKIMKIYHSQKANLDSTSRPKILGLTASPVVKKAKPKELR